MLFQNYDIIVPIPRAGNMVAFLVNQATGSKIEYDTSKVHPSQNQKVLIVDDCIRTGKALGKFIKRYPLLRDCDRYTVLAAEESKDKMFYSKLFCPDEWMFLAWELDDIPLYPFVSAYDFDNCLYPFDGINYDIDISKHLLLPRGSFEIISSRWECDRQKINNWANYHNLTVSNIILNEKKEDEITFKNRETRHLDIYIESDHDIAEKLSVTTISIDTLEMFRSDKD